MARLGLLWGLQTKKRQKQLRVSRLGSWQIGNDLDGIKLVTELYANDFLDF